MERRVDLDWIRILAFGSLILYHVGMYYVTWDYHVKSPFASGAIEPLMMFVNPWRLALLFLVSGAATAFMTAKYRPGALADSRTMRLLLPLFFGMLVIVPPQSYFEVVEKAGYTGSYGAFLLRYLTADDTFCRGRDCLVIPTWNHLWFVAYLWVYTMGIAALVAFGPALRERIERVFERALSGWGVLLWPWLVLALFRVTLIGRFPSTHALLDDWYNHALFFTVFATGFFIARSDRVWGAMERARWVALVAFLASYAFVEWYFLGRADPQNPPEALRMFQRVVYALDQWAAIVAACGFGRRLFKRDGPARRYLTDAVFPFYIVHQTAIIAFAMWMRPFKLQPLVEGPLLILLVALACLAAYEVVRRVAWLRPLFGLKPEAQGA
jgi:surface polysaccharide O-acyltransferase-like enzyme